MENKNIIQKVVVGGVIVNNNKILIVQRNSNEDIFPNMWELPSGKKENLETAEQSLIREIKEETGIDVNIKFPFNVFNYQIEKDGVIKDSTQINYFVEPLNDDVKIFLSEEHQAFAWVDIESVDVYNLSDSTKSVIRSAFKIIFPDNI